MAVGPRVVPVGVLTRMAIGLAAAGALLAVLMIAYLAVLGAQSRNMTVTLGVVDGQLRAGPSTPNCVSSDVGPNDSHYIPAIEDASGERWGRLADAVGALPGAERVTMSDDYAHFTFTSRLFGFVDDVELHYRPADGLIAVRSASRVGQGDLDANRKRVEAIRAALR